MARDTIDTILCNPHLPTLPSVAAQVLELVRSPNINMQEIARVIENDQALAVKVIRTVNSSYYGLSRPCATIRQAIVYLGLNTVKTLVLGFGLIESIEGSCEDYIGFDYVDYWRRALYSAAAAREIASVVGNVDPEEAFLAAIVQDLGMIAMHRTYKDVYLQAIDLTQGAHQKLPEQERKTFKTDHAEIGAAVAEHWKMPHQLVECIRFHHAPSKAPAEWSAILRVLELAQLSAALSISECRQSAREQFDRLARDHFGFNRQQIHRLVELMIETANELSQLFKINTGDVPRVEEMLAEAETQQIEHQARILREVELTQDSAADASERSAPVDPMTGLPGSMSFWSALQQRFQEAIDQGHCLAAIMCRIVPARSTGDGSGENEDAVKMHACRAASMARLLETQCGAAGQVYHYGTNCFVILLDQMDRREAARRAEWLRRQAVNLPQQAGATMKTIDPAECTVGFGVAALEPETSEIMTGPELLVGYADQALRAALNAGVNQVRVFVPSNTAGRAA